jgi:hypothetical protein
MKIVLNTKMNCLLLQPKYESEKRGLVLYCDSNWAGDPESRIPSISLESQSVEDVRFRKELYCQVVKTSMWLRWKRSKIRFIIHLLRTIFIEVRLPIIWRCDNVGVIFIVEKSCSEASTRQIDTRYHFFFPNNLMHISKYNVP